MNDELLQSYEKFPYESFPFPQSHPDRLATIGTLFGMEPTPIGKARVLEVGCASGGNLIPIAATLPDSEFVGVDFSPAQIERGAADIATLGLPNIRLLAMDIMDFNEDFGAFDYIIAHGVYSWVPNAVQERLLAICARQLAPQGIAYVSYNTLPGWRMRSVVRDAMTFHTRMIADPAERVAKAREILEFLAESFKKDESPYGVGLRLEAAYLRQQADFYIYHDFLEHVNEPLYFHQFIERAARHGLSYLGEADFGSMLGSEFSPEVQQRLARDAPDVLKREQYMDFLRARIFRETLLVKEGVELNRKVSPSRVMALRVASVASPVGPGIDLATSAPEVFGMPNGASATVRQRVSRAAMALLAERWPLALAFDDLHAAAQARLASAGVALDEERGALATEILQCYAAGVVELRHAPSPFVVHPGERPEASAVARLQAGRGAPATSLRHDHGSFNAETLRLFLLLDGTRTRHEIAAAIWPGVPETVSLPKLSTALDHFARLALMTR